MTLQEFNTLDKEKAKQELLSCCGSAKWASSLVAHFPFINERDLVDKATGIWYNECTKPDWLEAFEHHPKIGDVKSLEEKFATTRRLAGAEQASVTKATASVIEALAKRNKEYEEKFGFIFIVFATGKSAEEMLKLLEDRLGDHLPEEVNIAMGEQHKITMLRLRKLLAESDWTFLKPSHITTHVLDTSMGTPGRNVTTKLQGQTPEGAWTTITLGVTNADGRIGNLLPEGRMLPSGIYKMVFHTGKYFLDNQIKGFYPEVEIQFNISDDQHYHVPLLINPFGYSTYRGS